MIKRAHLFFLLFFIFTLSQSHPVNAQINYWMQRAGGVTPDEGSDISIDANGNTYTTGYFTGSAKFGTTTLNSSGVTDIFITKVDNQGLFKWAVKAGGNGADKGLSIKADAQGNTYITGFYYGTATFGSQSITSQGIQDLFIAKYDNSGVLQWVKSAGGTDSDIGNGINIDNAGNVVVTGEFKGTASFGSFSLTSKNNSIDVFTTKLDAAGNFLWAKKGSAIFTDRGLDVACDASGNVYVTGQFTDTITFDNTHLNTMYNVIFLIKYDAGGTEQWFRVIGGGTFNISTGIAVDASDNVYLTGDFKGNLIFFGTTNTTLTNAYANKIFVSKYDKAGNFLWAHADGSNGELTSRNIALDASGNAYIIGNFKCRLNEYADKYGQGTFNTVGFWDIFVSKYTTAGTWQWSRQCGGVQDDYGAGITVDLAEQVHIAGSFYQNINFPTSSKFIGYNSAFFYCQNPYCSDPEYGRYNQFNTMGNYDIIIAKNFDLAREPYDYYVRNGAGCNRPYVGVCIANGNINCPDSVSYCGSGSISAVSNVTVAGSDFNYLWSTGSTLSYVYVKTSGYYWVKQTTADGCFESTDSIYVTVHPFPLIPTISDSKGINTNAIITKRIVLCGDSVLLTGGNFGSNTYEWSGPTGTQNSTTIWATQTGTYYFTLTDKFGCISSNKVEVIIDAAFPVIGPKMICVQDTDKNDSVSICKGDSFKMYVYDTIANPSANGTCILDATYTWSASPDTVYYLPNTAYCQNDFFPTHAGTYEVIARVIRKNNCGSDTVIVKKSIYVDLIPLPLVTDSLSIKGKTIMCPGDSVLLIGSGDSFMWFNGSTKDSIWVYQPGTYGIQSTKKVTNSFGCSAMATDFATITILGPPQPTITMNPSNGLICPNDSVKLSCNGSGTFVWQGPSGPVGGNSSSIYVNTPGFYYCIRTDTNNCTLVSNTLLVNQYATPYLLATPSTVLCGGDSVVISVITNAGSSIQWQAPFSGSSLTQIVTAPGTYTCMVTSCGIQTVASITITQSNVTAQITAGGSLNFCDGDSVILSANGGMVSYLWQPGSVSQPSFTVYSTGTYSLTTIDNYGCTANAVPVKVTVKPNNVAEPVAADTSVCPGEKVTLAVSGGGNIQWYTAFTGETPFYNGFAYTTPGLITTTRYYLVAADSGCRSKRVPVTVTINDCDKIVVPTIFTPNKDGINDLFYFTILKTNCFECDIYNRWGILIYKWYDVNGGWDGTIRQTGKDASDGVYYFILNYCDYNDVKKEQTGFIQLLRNNY